MGRGVCVSFVGKCVCCVGRGVCVCCVDRGVCAGCVGKGVCVCVVGLSKWLKNDVRIFALKKHIYSNIFEFLVAH